MAYGNAADQALLQFVSREIRAGTRKVDIPAHLLDHVTEEAMQEAQQLAALSGVELVVHA